MEVVVSVANEILNKLVNEAILQASYPFRFNKCVKELDIEKENLQSKIQEVLDHAKDAKKKTHKIVSQVEKWLNEADFLMAKVVELQEKVKKKSMTYCLKHCPNLISRYNLTKQLEETTNQIRTHSQVQFPEFSRLATLMGMNYFSSDGFVHFDSRNAAYDGLLRALKDEKIHMIGLHGMGGSGKTTLAKEVGKEAENFFDKVVFVVVSNTIDVRKIQSMIASQLNLELKEEDNLERARRLFMRLSSGERFLIILDDVWEKLDFEDIGIPTTNNEMGCTILITTRKLHVCELMNCQKIIPLESLNEGESWDLFQKHVGLFDDHHSNTLKNTAQKIAKECAGLPVAIAAVANALKGKPHDRWVEALKTLRDPSYIDVEESLKSTYRCLRLSYDNLENEVAKSLFLFCSVYPEDYEIRIQDLTMIGVGLGLVGEIVSYRARTQVINKAIKKLIDSCLLQKFGNYRNCLVIMHDLVRDVAQWIAKKESRCIMGPLKEDMVVDDPVVRYLWFEKVDKCPSILNCPELEFLHISIRSQSCVTIPKGLFNGMEKLRVLILSNSSVTEYLPLQLLLSLHLTNQLRCLILRGWVLSDLSFMESLETLESLIISWGCSFDELPQCIIQYKKLRLLYLQDCDIQRNPFEVLGRCSQLEVLYFYDNRGEEWEEHNKNSAKFFDKICASTTQALESYCIQFGNRKKAKMLPIDYMDCNSFVARGLHIEDFESCISFATSKDMMRRAKSLTLRGIPTSWKNIFPNLWQTIGGGMNELAGLALHDSDGTECLIGHANANNLSQVGGISNLTHLRLVKVKHLKSLYSGQPPHGLFANLEVLEIETCDSFEHVLTEEDVVKEIVDTSEHQNAFPRLKSLYIVKCKKLEYLMPTSFTKSLAHLEHLSLDSNDELKSLLVPSLDKDLNLNKPQAVEFSALTVLILENLPKVIRIYPENYHPTWPSLEVLSLYNCPLLNIEPICHWVACGGLSKEDNHIIVEDFVTSLERLKEFTLGNHKVEVAYDVEKLPLKGQQVINLNLRRFWFTELPPMRHIWRGPKNSILLQHLEMIDLKRCGNLKHIFPPSIVKSLPLLKELSIRYCDELEEIIKQEEEEDQSVSNSSQIVFPKLVTVIIKCCNKLKSVFPKTSSCRVIPNLKALYIKDASRLEKVYEHEQHDLTSLEYVLLWNLPSLTSVAPSTSLQTFKYIVVQQCPKLSPNSSVTPQEFLTQLSPVYFYGSYTIEKELKKIIKFMHDSTREPLQQIDCQETGGQSSDQKLTIISTPNLIEHKEESEDRRGAHEQQTSKGKTVEECSTSKNVQTVASLAHSEPISSTKSVNQIIPGLEISSAMPASLSLPQSISMKSATDPKDTSLHKTPSDKTELLNTISTCQSELNYQQQKSLEKFEIAKEDVKGIHEDSLSSEKANISTPSTDSELATSSTKNVPHIQRQISQKETFIDKSTKSTRISNLQDLKDDDLISFLQDLEDEYGSKSPISSDPTAAIAKDELVTKALADLEDSLKKPLKDIATSDANSLHLQTALNFLSRLSLEDGALSNEAMATIKSLHKDLPNILSSFKQALATVNKFAVLEERDKSIKDELSQRKEAAFTLVSKMSETKKSMDKAQEKKAKLQEQISWLEKEITDGEFELMSLQEQKRKYIAEATELKEEIGAVTKEKSEMVEDQRSARKQLFQADHKWSVLGSKFEQHNASTNLS